MATYQQTAMPLPQPNPQPASFTIIWLAVESASMRLCVSICICAFMRLCTCVI